MRSSWIFILVLFGAILVPCHTTDACSMFFMYKNGVMMGGANEDWRDPNTMMWFFPADSTNKAWVKFGFLSGFPQAGMNECGLFWDGTSNPYLPMPMSEENKEFYNGPIMEKVIKECSNVEEALSIFGQYYCQDQYKAQYLVCDSSGNSIIVEGDNILHPSQDYQVLTNFYQSQPELGGYPCWRYETATSMLDTINTINEYSAAAILASTHQDGNFPTQYSLIFKPNQAELILFYYHNFDEYLYINLQEELHRGARAFSIPEIFSCIELSGPDNGSEIVVDSVTIRWKGLPNSKYEILLSKYPDMHDVFIYEHEQSPIRNKSASYIGALSCLIIIMIIKRKDLKTILGIALLSYVIISCSKTQEEPANEDPRISFTQEITSLEAGTNYYWNIKAQSSEDAYFHTETPVYQFSTAEHTP